MSFRRRLAEAQVALMLLTRLPAGSLPDPVPTLAEARWAYPFAGLPVGLIGWAGYSALHGTSPALAAVAALAAMALVTGGLHHDGLADFADGLGGRDRAHSLEIMRDSRIGSFGVLALIFTVALCVAGLASIGAPAFALLLLIGCASRFAMLAALLLLPAARDDGLGRSATDPAGASWLPSAALIAILALFAGPVAVAVLLATATLATLTCRIALHRLGGQTGDVLGAVQLLSETAGWVAAAAWLGATNAA